jgi:hypothetical protein
MLNNDFYNIDQLSNAIYEYKEMRAFSKGNLLQRIKESTQNVLNYFKDIQPLNPIVINAIKEIIPQLEEIDSKLAISLRRVLEVSFKGTKRTHDSMLSSPNIEKEKDHQQSLNESVNDNTRPHKTRRLDFDEIQSEEHFDAISCDRLEHSPSRPTNQKMEEWIGFNLFQKNYDEIQKRVNYHFLAELKEIESSILDACFEIYQSEDKEYFQNWSRELLVTLSETPVREYRKTVMDYLESLLRQQKKEKLINSTMIWIEMCLVPRPTDQRLSQTNSGSTHSNANLESIKMDLNWMITHYCPSLQDHHVEACQMIDQTADIKLLIRLKEKIFKTLNISLKKFEAILNVKAKNEPIPSTSQEEQWIILSDLLMNSETINHPYHQNQENDVFDYPESRTPMEPQIMIPEFKTTALGGDSIWDLACLENITPSIVSQHSLENTQKNLNLKSVESNVSIKDLTTTLAPSHPSVDSMRSELSTWLRCNFFIQDIAFIEETVNAISDVNTLSYLLNNRTNNTFNSFDDVMVFIYK